MYRWTTPTQPILIDTDVSQMRVYVVYKQNGKVVVEKTNEDISFVEGAILVPLSQEETGLFEPGVAKVQVRCIDKDGLSMVGPSMAFSVRDTYKEGVLSYGD